MIDWLYSIDITLFRWGNLSLVCAPGDWFFTIITEVKNFYIIYALAIAGLLVFGKEKGRVTVAALFVAILIGDQLSSSVIKPLIGRIRPCASLEDVRLLAACGAGKSFPSSHAVNNFAAAILIGYFYRKALPYLLFWALLVAFSRVYVGVHYPSDILAGAAIGGIVAWAVIGAYNMIEKKWFLKFRTDKTKAADEAL